MCTKIFFIFSTLLSISVDTTLIDQRQSGDLNVQVELKGLQIIALMKGGKEEYVDYDYAYDYSEMTIKPQNRTTPKPLNFTSTTATDKLDAIETNATTLIIETTTPLTLASETVGVTVDQTVNDDNITIKSTASYNVTELPTILPNSTVVTTTISNINSTITTTTACKKGFVLNIKGDCEIKLQGAGNALLKLVKLSQKLKLRRENRSESADAD